MRLFLAAAAVTALAIPAAGQGTATPYGAGCTAPLARAFGFAPNPGAGELQLYQTGVVTGSVPVALLGFSATSWGAVALPLPLTSLGLPTCSVLAEPVLLAGATAPGGVAEYELTVPGATTVLGGQLFAQWVHAGDGSLGGALPVTLSAGVAFTFGTTLGTRRARGRYERRGFCLWREGLHAVDLGWTTAALRCRGLPNELGENRVPDQATLVHNARAADSRLLG